MRKSNIPEAALIRNELVLRDLLLTSEVKNTGPSLVRWLALSLGVISPNESRRSAVDLLDVLLRAHFSGRELGAEEIVERLEKQNKLVSEKTVRYHLLRLTNAGLLERARGKYRFFVPPLADRSDVAASIESVVRSRTEVSLAKIKDALRTLKHMYK